MPAQLETVPVLQGTLDMLILKTLAWEPKHGFGILRHIFTSFMKFREDILCGVFSIQAFPDEHTDRVKAESITRIRIKKYRPIVEFFPQHDQGIGYWFGG